MGILASIGEFIKRQVFLADALATTQSELKDAREEILLLSKKIDMVANETARTRERIESEHEKLLLKLENRFLIYERDNNIKTQALALNASQEQGEQRDTESQPGVD